MGVEGFSGLEFTRVGFRVLGSKLWGGRGPGPFRVGCTQAQSVKVLARILQRIQNDPVLDPYSLNDPSRRALGFIEAVYLEGQRTS